ncbi:MAG: zinc ribbon domain-containing protein [Sedimentisphaerales bacterium]|nr:zinc ribbon domain-containing protein [Sedimentisphaerales bacterium]
MPTYEYICENCEYEFEKFQTITARPLRTCPECGKKKLKRLIGTGAGIIFKGSGFYETDYRSENYKKAVENEKKEPKSAGKDSKTDLKKESKIKTEKKDKKKKA